MPLLQPALSSGLANLEPTMVEADSIQAFVGAWDGYFAGASVSGIPAAPGSYAGGLSAMQGALVGWSAPNAAAAAIQSAVTAFWTAILPAGTAIWVLPPPAVVTPPLVMPPTVGAIAAALNSLFSSLAAGNATLLQAADQMATALHSNGGVGGLAPVTIAPAGPVPTPIL